MTVPYYAGSSMLHVYYNCRTPIQRLHVQYLYIIHKHVHVHVLYMYIYVYICICSTKQKSFTFVSVLWYHHA